MESTEITEIVFFWWYLLIHAMKNVDRITEYSFEIFKFEPKGGNRIRMRFWNLSKKVGIDYDVNICEEKAGIN